jgi:hypothetical protein
MSIFDTSASATPTSIQQQSVTPYAQPLASQLVNQATALGNTPLPKYTGELAAGPSALQNQAFQGIANLTLPTGFTTAANNLGNVASQAQNIGGTYTPVDFTNTYTSPGAYQGITATSQNFDAGAAQQYMNPYLQASLQPQLQLLNQQLGTQNNALGAKLAQAGAFGGGRQAVEESQNALNNNLAANTLISSGYNTAYNNAMNQFNADQARNMQAQQANIQQAQFGTTTGLTEAQQAAQALQNQQAAQAQQAQYRSNLGLQGLQLGTTASQALGQNTQMQNQNQLANLQEQEKAGTTQQGLAQAADTAAYNQYLLQLQYPQQMLTAQENAFKSVPTTNLLTYGTTPSTFQNISSIGGGLQSLLSAIGGNQPAGSGTSSTMAGLQTVSGGLSNLLGLNSGSNSGALDTMANAYSTDSSGNYSG